MPDLNQEQADKLIFEMSTLNQNQRYILSTWVYDRGEVSLESLLERANSLSHPAPRSPRLELVGRMSEALWRDHDIALPDPERYVGREDATATGWDAMFENALQAFSYKLHDQQSVVV